MEDIYLFLTNKLWIWTSNLNYHPNITYTQLIMWGGLPTKLGKDYFTSIFREKKLQSYKWEKFGASTSFWMTTYFSILFLLGWPDTKFCLSMKKTRTITVIWSLTYMSIFRWSSGTWCSRIRVYSSLKLSPTSGCYPWWLIFLKNLFYLNNWKETMNIEEVKLGVPFLI